MPMSRNEQIQITFQTDFPASEFLARRNKVFDAIGPDACAVVQGASVPNRSELFRQTNEFYYLCGVEAPQAYLFFNGRKRTAILLLAPRDERREHSGGVAISAEDGEIVKALTGADETAAPNRLPELLKDFNKIYTPFSPAEGPAMYRDELTAAEKSIQADIWEARPSREQIFIERLRAQSPQAVIENLTPVLDRMRLIKSPREVEVMREAGKLTARGLNEAMKGTRPGIREYHLAAMANFVYRAGGARGESYCPISASGENIWYPHYNRNDCMLASGDWVIFDCAPDLRYYTSDIGRIWPVNGKYSPVQRELYGFVTHYHQVLLKHIRPGIHAGQILETAAVEMEPVLARTRFSKPVYQEAARKLLKYKGNLSHSVGMGVHDVGNYWDRPLETGLVFSVDPQLWVPDEKLYVRVEDTVVVTETGIEVLTALSPLNLDEIENNVGRSVVLQGFW